MKCIVLVFCLVTAAIGTTDSQLSIEFIGFDPSGELIALHEDVSGGSGGYEYYLVIRTADMSIFKKFEINDTADGDDSSDTWEEYLHRLEAKREAVKKELELLHIAPGVEMPGVNDCRGSYRQLDENSTLKLIVDISPLILNTLKMLSDYGLASDYMPLCEYRLEIHDAQEQSIKVIAQNSIRDYQSLEGYELRSVYLSSDRNHGVAIVRKYYSAVGELRIDVVHAFQLHER